MGIALLPSLLVPSVVLGDLLLSLLRKQVVIRASFVSSVEWPEEANMVFSLGGGRSAAGMFIS